MGFTRNRYNGKYNAKKIVIDGHEFASNKEAKRYGELSYLLEQGKIKDLEIQKEFLLIPTQREPDIIGKRGGVKKGKVIEQSVKYVADFVYTDVETGEMVVEDVKGYRDPASAGIVKYILKRKMMLYFHGIRIKEI